MQRLALNQKRLLSNKYKKNGAPIKAVTMPIGNSAGAKIKRAAKSANSNKLAPANAEAGNNTR